VKDCAPSQHPGHVAVLRSVNFLRMNVVVALSLACAFAVGMSAPSLEPQSVDMEDSLSEAQPLKRCSDARRKESLESPEDSGSLSTSSFTGSGAISRKHGTRWE